jgi:DNA repair exonuclease SbcCD ATPase subunit
VIENMNFLTGRPESNSTVSVKEFVSETDNENLLCIQESLPELQAMDLAFANGIEQLQSARTNIDREISAFDVLDRFLYDPSGVQKVNQYRSQLNSVIGTTDLNPVNSAMALGTQAVLEMVRFAKEVDPGFELSDIETRVSQLESETESLTAERNKVEFESQLSQEVVLLAQQVEKKHDDLQTNLRRYNRTVISRSGNVERTFQIINSLNLPLPQTSNVTPSETEAKAGHNTFLFLASCMRA